MGSPRPLHKDRPWRYTPSRRVVDVAGEPQSSKGPALQDILLVQQGTTAQGYKALLSHSLKELTFTQHSQSVLRTKDMNTKLLDGLEMFLGVCVCDVLVLQQLQNGRGMAYI